MGEVLVTQRSPVEDTCTDRLSEERSSDWHKRPVLLVSGATHRYRLPGSVCDSSLRCPGTDAYSSWDMVPGRSGPSIWFDACHTVVLCAHNAAKTHDHDDYAAAAGLFSHPLPVCLSRGMPGSAVRSRSRVAHHAPLSVHRKHQLLQLRALCSPPDAVGPPDQPAHPGSLDPESGGALAHALFLPPQYPVYCALHPAGGEPHLGEDGLSAQGRAAPCDQHITVCHRRGSGYLRSLTRLHASPPCQHYCVVACHRPRDWRFMVTDRRRRHVRRQ